MGTKASGSATAWLAFLVFVLSGCAGNPTETPPAGRSAAPPAAKVWLGTMTRSVDFTPSIQTDGAASGARIEMVAPGSPADKAGLVAGDIVLFADNQAITSGEALISVVRAVQAPRAMPISALREGTKISVTVPLEARPEDANKRFGDALIGAIRAKQDAAHAAEQSGEAKQAFEDYIKAVRLLLLQERDFHARVDQPMDFDIAHMAVLLKQAGLRPAIPEEADRHNRRAISVLKSATRDEDNDRAAFEFREAIYEAPWVPDLHLNRGLALEKAGYTEAAIGELRRYLVLNAAAPDAASVKQKITELEVLADERRPWYPLLGPWNYADGKSEQLKLRGRTLILTLVTPSGKPVSADRPGDVICRGTIHGSQMQGKCYDRPTDLNDIKCLGATQEYDARGAIDASGQFVIEANHYIHFNPQTCQINSQQWSRLRTFTPRSQ